VKTITIRLPDVEAAMLMELRQVDSDYRDIQKSFLQQLRKEYRSRFGGG